jgi:hypothetical protein
MHPQEKRRKSKKSREIKNAPKSTNKRSKKTVKSKIVNPTVITVKYG